MFAELDPLFAADLFFWFFNFEDSEVPAVNKPRRACLYVTDAHSLKGSKNIIYYFSELFSPDSIRIER
jgi:hypothetical protein